MKRVLNLKKGDKCVVAIKKNVEIFKHRVTAKLDIEKWIFEGEVVTTSKKYITVSFIEGLEKFEKDRDYQQRVNKGESEYKLYKSLEEINEIMEFKDIYKDIQTRITSYNEKDFTLNQLRRIMEIINE